MAKLIMTRGLPASGKSTWAKAQVELNPATTARINKDDIRLAMGKPWSYEVEKEVLRERDWEIIQAFRRGCTVVISDDTNFALKHESRLRWLARENGATFEFKDFTDVPMEECLRRNALREPPARVDGRVIIDMYNKYLDPLAQKGGSLAFKGKKMEPDFVPTPYIANPSLPSAIICDLDGTLALHQGRGPFDFAKCDTDRVNAPIRALLWAMAGNGSAIIYLSGRDDSCKDKTAQWIKDVQCPNPRRLYMRTTGDKRKDCIVKHELFDAHVRDQFNVVFALDDRDQVVKLWRDMGLTCLQVAYGNF